MRAVSVEQDQARGLALPPSSMTAGSSSDPVCLETAPFLVAFRWCLLTRLALVSLLFLFSLILHTHNEASSSLSEVGSLFRLLLAAWGFSLLSAGAIRFRPFRPVLGGLQVAWDLLFSVLWIYCTGGSGSLFVFLYLFVIMEATALIGAYGGLVTAFLCGLLYWIELHLEINGVIAPKAAPIAAPILTRPERYPVALLVFILASMLSTAWLTSTLRQRLFKAGLLLQEKSANIRELIHLNDSIVRCIRSGLVTLNQAGRITSFNEAAAAITGCAGGEVLGDTFERILGPIPLDALYGGNDKATLPFRWEQPFLHRGGKVLTLGFSASILRDHREEAFGHLLIFQDLTLYKRMEEELRRAEKLAAVGELAAGLAHEIRNPLASLYGAIQVLGGELNLSGSNERLMQIILQESERLNDLIRDFLLFASPRPIPKEWFRLLPILEETQELLEKSPCFSEEIRVLLRVDPSLSLFANRKQIQQILWNLLLNAVQAMPGEGEIQIEAEREKMEGNGAGRVVIRIRDTGKGIPPENLDRIFDPFFTTREEGTGLGLAVVYRIVESHGGRIHVNSEAASGTVFQIELPMEEASGSEQAHPASREFVGKGPLLDMHTR